MDRNELAARMHEVAHLTGSFTLRSGQESAEYFDKFQFTSRPVLLDAVAAAMADLIAPDVEVLAGLQLGGVPLAAALSLRTGLPAVYVRLARKSHGTRRISEGVPIDGRRLAIVEDVVTTGGQIVLSTGELRAEGADVAYALAAVDREQGGAEALAAAQIELRAAFTSSALQRAASIAARRSVADGAGAGGVA